MPPSQVSLVEHVKKHLVRSWATPIMVAYTHLRTVPHCGVLPGVDSLQCKPMRTPFVDNILYMYVYIFYSPSWLLMLTLYRSKVVGLQHLILMRKKGSYSHGCECNRVMRLVVVLCDIPCPLTFEFLQGFIMAN